MMKQLLRKAKTYKSLVVFNNYFKHLLIPGYIYILQFTFLPIIVVHKIRTLLTIVKSKLQTYDSEHIINNYPESGRSFLPYRKG